MMSTRRTLFVFGAFLAVGVLLAPEVVFAQASAPQNVAAATGSAPGTVDVTWEAPATNPQDVSMYEITWAKSTTVVAAGDVPTSPAPAMLNSVANHLLKHTITGLEAEASYSVAVRVLNGNDTRTAWEAGAAVATAGAAAVKPAAPMGVEAVSGDEMVTVKWEAVTGATGYMVQWRTASQGYSVTTRMVMAMANATMAEAKPLENGMEYMFQVRTQMGDGNYSDGSAEVKQTPMADMMDVPAPTNVKLEPSGRNMITAKWDYGGDGTDTATGFQIGWTEAAGTEFTDALSPQRIVSVTGGREARSYTLDLKVNDEYLIGVRAVHGDASGDPIAYSSWSYRAAARESTPAEATRPQNVTVRSMDGELMVTWDAVASVGMCEDAAVGARCGYLVEWRAAHQSFDNPDRQMTVRDKLSATIPNLMNGTEYGVVVSSMNEKTAKSESSIEARQTPMMPTPALPVFGVLALGAGLVAAGRRRLRARRQARLLKS